MCLDCGCMKPDDRHGDKRHIIMQDFVEAAEASDLPVQEALRNIDQATRKVADGTLKSQAWTPKK
jgi:hypothetical protein